MNDQVADYKPTGFVLIALEQAGQETQNIVESRAPVRVVPLRQLSVVLAHDQSEAFDSVLEPIKVSFQNSVS